MPSALPPKVPASVSDFSILPLQIPPQPSFPTSTTHYLYLRAHAPKAPTATTNRELFLVNVPVDATESKIFNLFAEQLGGLRVEAVAFESARVGKGISAPVAPAQKGTKRKRGQEDGPVTEEEGGDAQVAQLPEVWDRRLHRSGSTAVVTFVDRPSAEAALRHVRKAIRAKRPIAWRDSPQDAPLGSARYLAHQRLRYPASSRLQASVDEYMAAFAAQEAETAKRLKHQRSVPDDDGFVTVTRGGRNGPAREAETRAKMEEYAKREKARISDGFYRFQVREKRKEQAQDLVKGFQEDQRRLAELKKRRGKIRPE